MIKIFFVGGGSVGHIAPSVAVEEALASLVNDLESHYVCSPRPHDAAFLEANGKKYTIFDAPRLSVLFPLKIMSAYRRAARLLAAEKPDMIFSKGGYVSIPICLAAKKRGIPVVLHESDAVSGKANALVGKFAEKICLGFPPEAASERMYFTGNPIRTSVVQGSREDGMRITGFSGERPVLLVMGGSQGAESINRAVIDRLSSLLTLCDIVHITGQGKSEATHRQGYFPLEFAHEELPHLYALADLCINRAGAGSIAELAGNGIATILVPLRGIGHDHQQFNAEHLEEQGACILLQQDDLHRKLENNVQMLLKDTIKCDQLREAISSYYQPNAAQKIAECLHSILASADANPYPK